VVFPGKQNTQVMANYFIRMGANPLSQGREAELKYKEIPFIYTTPQRSIKNAFGVYFHGNAETTQ
jgi:hypothetical protein